MSKHKHIFTEDGYELMPDGEYGVRCRTCDAYGVECEACKGNGCRTCKRSGVKVMGTAYECQSDAEFAITSRYEGEIQTDAVLVPADSPDQAAAKFRGLYGRWPAAINYEEYEPPSEEAPTP